MWGRVPPTIQVLSSPKMEDFFSPNSSGNLRSDADQGQIIGGMQIRPYSNYWGDISPWVSAPLVTTIKTKTCRKVDSDKTLITKTTAKIKTNIKAKYVALK